MKLFVYKGKQPNFGDELNHWLWPKLLPDFFDEDERDLFLGIGSVLYDSHPDTSRKIVFGAGYGGYTPLPKHDDMWEFHFVRGPATARALGLDEALGIGDPALLVRLLVPESQRTIHYPVSYMPHFESIITGSWQDACQAADIHFIDPTQDVEVILESILASGLIISEAMHGVIVADALRIPWRAVQPLNPLHRRKWLDWGEALQVDIDFTDIGASNMLEQCSRHLFHHRRHLDRFQRYQHLGRAIGMGTPSKNVIRKLSKAAASVGQLSNSDVILATEEKMREKLTNFKQRYEIK